MRLPVPLLLLASCLSRGLASVKEKMTFAESLFKQSLPLANLSLHGEFITQMAAGTLPDEAFQRYLHQDNLYLSKYARAFAVLAARSAGNDGVYWFSKQVVQYLDEHGKGPQAAINETVFEREASSVTVQYTSFLTQAAWSEELLLAYVAVVPCQRLYDWLFQKIKAMYVIAPGNLYKDFIEQYADPANHKTTLQLESFLNQAASGITADLAERAALHYNTAMRYEAEFFAQGLQGSDGFASDSHPSAGAVALVSRAAGRRMAADLQDREGTAVVNGRLPLSLMVALVAVAALIFALAVRPVIFGVEQTLLSQGSCMHENLLERTAAA